MDLLEAIKRQLFSSHRVTTPEHFHGTITIHGCVVTLMKQQEVDDV